MNVHSPGVITKVSQASSTHSAIAVNGEETTKAAKPSVVPARPAGRAKRRSGTARAGSATASLLPLEPVSAMAKGEARVITVRIATRRVFFIIIDVKSGLDFVNNSFCCLETTLLPATRSPKENAWKLIVFEDGWLAAITDLAPKSLGMVQIC